MIERHVTFDVLPERTADFERFFREQYLPAVRAMPDLIECLLLREAENPLRYQMVFRWVTADAATAWRTSAAHQSLQPALSALNSAMSIVAYGQVA
jgi:heme-degrading monooxygenase HmoA